MRISDWSSDVCSSDLDVPGAIPIPATLSIEFGEVIGAKAGIVGYRFVSDYPFANRASDELDAFARRALETFRQSRRPDAAMSEATGALINRRIPYPTPDITGPPRAPYPDPHPAGPPPHWQIRHQRGHSEQPLNTQDT